MRRGALRVAAGFLLGATITGCSLIGGGHPDVTTALRDRRLMVPVVGVRPDEVPDDFAAARARGRRHGAVDIPAPRGTTVVSADDGMVVAVRESRRGGRTIYATDPARQFIYYYAHLDTYRRGLRAGTPVAKGDPLGTVGTTGNADRAGPHLHFQVKVSAGDGRWWAGPAVDPRPYFVLAGRLRSS